MHMGAGEEAEGEMYGESNMEIDNTVCKTDSQRESAAWLRELKQGLCDNLGGWDGEGDGREVWEGGDLGVPMADSCCCMTQNYKIILSNYPSIKKISLKKRSISIFLNEYPYNWLFRITSLQIRLKGRNCRRLERLTRPQPCPQFPSEV